MESVDRVLLEGNILVEDERVRLIEEERMRRREERMRPIEERMRRREERMRQIEEERMRRRKERMRRREERMRRREERVYLIEDRMRMLTRPIEERLRQIEEERMRQREERMRQRDALWVCPLDVELLDVELEYDKRLQIEAERMCQSKDALMNELWNRIFVPEEAKLLNEIEIECLRQRNIEPLRRIDESQKEKLRIEMMHLRQIKGRLRQIEKGRRRQIEKGRLRQIEKRLRRIEKCLQRKRVCLILSQIKVKRLLYLLEEPTSQPLKIIVAYDVQGGSSGPMKVEKGLTKKKTHKGAKGGRGRERSISEGRDGKAIRDINRDCDPAPHIQKTGRPQVRFHFSQANGGVEGQEESWDGLEREKGSGGRDGGSMGGGHEEEAVPDIKRDCHQTLHIERNRRPEVGFGVSQANGSVERQGGSPDECRDAEGEGSRSGANQARDGEGERSSSGESQGQDREEGNASGENQGGDRNAEGSGSSDDEDEDERERERQRRVRGDIEHGRQERNQEEIDFSSIPETFMAIIGAVTIAAVDFHSSGAISSTILSLLIAINLFGFLCCMTSMLHRHRKPRAARIFGTIGVAAAGLALLLLVSVYFSSYYGWMILGLGSLAILVICVWAFRP